MGHVQRAPYVALPIDSDRDWEGAQAGIPVLPEIPEGAYVGYSGSNSLRWVHD